MMYRLATSINTRADEADLEKCFDENNENPTHSLGMLLLYVCMDVSIFLHQLIGAMLTNRHSTT